ncbi:MAG: hypothetical protein GY855_04050, partial [candidate division Zixibacteria bacterium]|nr:hypothetical protein [candidate division Zixibacteria bacterium]
QLSTAETLQDGEKLFGSYIGLYEHGTIIGIGQFRSGLNPFTDWGLRAGVVSIDTGFKNKAGVIIGGDIKYRLFNAAGGDEFDLSTGGMLETVFTSDFYIYSIGGQFIGSYRLVSSSGYLIVPYSRILVGIQNIHWDKFGPKGKGNTDTDFKICLNVGTTFKLNNQITLLAELQIDDDYFGLTAGVSFLK